MARLSLSGTCISPGLVTGKIHLVPKPKTERCQIGLGQILAEKKRLYHAARMVRKDLQTIIDGLPESFIEYAEIISVQQSLVTDLKFLRNIGKKIEERQICAPWALEITLAEISETFQAMQNIHIRERFQDIRTSALRLQNMLLGVETNKPDQACILLAEDLAASDILEIEHSLIKGLVTTNGGSTSHSAILARNLQIPAISAVAKIEQIENNEEVILDAVKGLLLVAPDIEEKTLYKELASQHRTWQIEMCDTANEPAKTKDAVQIHIQANINRVDEIPIALNNGAEAVGLYRTEIALQNSNSQNSNLASSLHERMEANANLDEETLVADYLQAASLLKPKRIVFRVLDYAADKITASDLSNFSNKTIFALRGIRFCIQHPEVLRLQLRAILRASIYNNVALLLPMVTSVQEIVFVHQLLAEIRQELKEKKIDHVAYLPLGIMIETPVAALTTDLLAKHCDFFSIGTNDLCQYLLAIERSNPQLDRSENIFHPGLLRILQQIIKSSQSVNMPLSICGELASEPLFLVLLIGLGVRTISVAPQFIAAIKYFIRKLSFVDCQAIAKAALEAEDSKSIYQILQQKVQNLAQSELDFYIKDILTKYE